MELKPFHYNTAWQEILVNFGLLIHSYKTVSLYNLDQYIYSGNRHNGLISNNTKAVTVGNKWMAMFNI